MKGINGLIVAVVLGIAGAAINFYYLNSEAQKKDMVAFIGIKKGVLVGRGDLLKEEYLAKVEIPANHVGNLRDYAYLWEQRIGVKDMPVWRTLDSKTEGEGALLLLRSDFRTPPKELELGKGEVAACILVPRNFVTAHVNPGAKISFRVATLAPPGPTPAPKPSVATATGATVSGAADIQPKPEESENAPLGAGPSEVIGPFVVVAIGNRLGSPEVMKAGKIAPVQENVLMIRVSKNVAGEEEKYEKLMTCIHRSGANSYDILLHGKE